MVNTLLHRAFTICSTYHLFHCEIEILKQHLYLNGFKRLILDKIIKNFLNLRQTPINKAPTVPRQRIYVTLPFYGQLSMTIRSSLRQILSQAYPQIEFVFSYRSVMRLQNFFRVKDCFPRDLASRVVYRYTCNCCDAVYIGKTDRHFGTRRGEHIGFSLRTGRSIKPKIDSAIYQHYEKTGHVLKDNLFEIIDRSHDDFSVHIKEAIHIVLSKPNLNTQSEHPFLVLMQN